MDNNIYSDLNTTLVRFILSAYHANDFRALDDLGVSKDQINRLVQMPAIQMQKFSGLRTPLANIKFCQRRFDIFIDTIDKEATRDDIINQMIKLDASAAMLDTMAGLDITEFRARRIKLGMDKASQGRPASLLPDESIILDDAWLKHKVEPDELIRYLKVGLETNLPLNRVWAYIRLGDC